MRIKNYIFQKSRNNLILLLTNSISKACISVYRKYDKENYQDKKKKITDNNN